MDDYSLSSLSESKNEWCARLVKTLTPAIIEGLRSIYKEAFELCILFMSLRSQQIPISPYN